MATSNNIISQRRHDLDNLRTFLTSLVTVHHTSLVYGGVGSGGPRSVLIPPDAQRLPLLLFNAYNQSFFMGAFFWISGRVSAQSLARPGRNRWQFVKDKALRLLLPAVAYTVTVQPIIGIVQLQSRTRDTILQYLDDYFTSLRGVRGPVWYTATLFAFDIVAAAFTSIADRDNEKKKDDARWKTVLSHQCWKYGWLGVAGVSFITRLYYPCGSTIALLNLQPGYLPQYVFAYALGHLSYYNEEELFPGFSSSSDPSQEKSIIGLTAASAISVAALSACILPYVMRDEPNWLSSTISEMMGGWNIGAVAYALWNELSFALLTPAVARVFYTRFNKRVASTLYQPRYSYAAFLIHWLVIAVNNVALEALLAPSKVPPAWTTALSWKAIGPVIMTAIMGSVNVTSSFVIGKWAIQSIPGLGMIL